MLGKMQGCIRGIVLLLLVLRANPVYSAQSTGRFVFGGYMAREVFSTPDAFLGDHNDVQTLSTRGSLKVTDWLESNDSFVADFRDKHDFFDKVDKERLQLTDSNSFQVKQFAYGTDHNGLNYRTGRFNLPDAGAVNVDGLQFNYKSDTNLGFVFFGLNPLEYGKSYLQFRPNAKILGLGYKFNPNSNESTRQFTSATALIQEMFGAEVDRRYLYQLFDYHLDSRNHLFASLYIDSVPSIGLQNGLAYWESIISSRVKTQLSFLAVDTVQYIRRQDVREQLSASPYRETELEGIYASENLGDLALRMTAGQRLVDGKTRTLASFRNRYSQLFGSRNVDGSWGFKGGKNFESADFEGQVQIGYFSRNWEAEFLQAYGQQSFTTTAYHPLTTQLTLSHFFSRALLASLSFDRVADERVEILSFFFHMSYRFGSRPIAPIRDGSPPRGTL